METINLIALHAMTVAAITPRLVELNKEQLEQLRALELEHGEEKARSTLLAVIDTRLEALAEQSANDDGTGGASEGTGAEATGTDGGSAEGVEAAGAGEAGEGFEDGGTGAAGDGAGVEGTGAGERLPDDLQAALASERERVARDAEIAASAADLRERSVLVARENAVRLYGEAKEKLGGLEAEDALFDGVELYFSEGESFIAGMDAVPIRTSQISVEGGRLIINDAIDFPPLAPSARIEAVWLHSLGDWAMTRLMQPLVIGGGHEARLPAGHLAFAVN